MNMSEARSILDHATALQKRAADPDASVWVAAAAGSGKTKVLIDRFVRLLLTGTPPHKILCLTYTQAAAAEMITRVTQRLSNWAICDNETLLASLRELLVTEDKTLPERELEDYSKRARNLFARALDCAGGLKIKTFHAFSQEILGRFPIEAGTPIHFTILTDATQRNLQELSLQDAVQTPVGAKAWRFLSCHLATAAIQDVLSEALRRRGKLAEALTKHGDAEKIVVALYKNLQLDLDQEPLSLILDAVNDDTLPLESLREAIALLRAHGGVTHQKKAEKLAAWLDLSAADRADEFEAYFKLFPSTGGVKPRTVLTADLAREYPQLEQALAAEGARVREILAASFKCQNAATTAALLRLSTAVIAAYDHRKAALAVLDFDDEIERVANLLERPDTAPWVLWKLDGGIDHIMIDEAQDTSPSQWRILQALTNEFFSGIGAREKRRTLFVVGDAKQSIYSFQHADPVAFQAMRRAFSQQIADSGQVFSDLPLTTSFRSAPIVLEMIDRVFQQSLASAGVSDVTVEHRASRADAYGSVVLHAAHRRTQTADDSVWAAAASYESRDNPAENLAQDIAAMIAGWLRDQRPVAVKTATGEAMRPIRAGDIMILVQKRNTLHAALLRALKHHGVKLMGADRLRLRQDLAVKDLLALIQAALLPEDDYNLACVLRGPFLGVDELVLARLCIGRESSLWKNLTADEECRNLTEWLRGIFAAADQGTIYEFLAGILAKPCPTAASGLIALVQRLGHEALDPIDELLNRAQDFPADLPASLQSFLRQIQHDDGEIKRSLEQAHDAVRIMTVHAAKGLQAPIVILPDCLSKPHHSQITQWHWDPETHLPCYTAISQDRRDPYTETFYRRARQAQMAEYRRLLYVAMTRAESELYAFAVNTTKPKKEKAEPDKPKTKPKENKPKESAELERSWYHLLLASWLAPPAERLIKTDLFDSGAEIFKQSTYPADTKLLVPQTVASQDLTERPSWLWESAAADNAIPRSMTAASRLSETIISPISALDKVWQRGKLIHRLLQSLPDQPQTLRAEAAHVFLASKAVPTATAETMIAEVMRLLEHPALAPVFAAGSRAEVPITGIVDGTRISGQIDRLVILPQEILLVDYKSGRSAPTDGTIPNAYRQQLATYRSLIQQIYPDRPVRCYVLWTQDCTITPLSEDMPDIAQIA
jgi:ATP-dependent helicase/nuclease subunit A